MALRNQSGGAAVACSVRRTLFSPFAIACVVAASTAGCTLFAGRATDPLPVDWRASKTADPAPPVVIVLPGRGDDLADLRDSGVAEAIQQAMPEAEVMLVGATLAYYLEGSLIERLQQQIVAPLRARGVREIWLAGISMGGMGAVMYEHDHPGEMRGLVLLSPYLGEREVVESVRDAGGLANWQAPALPATRDRTTVPWLEWQTVQTLTQSPTTARRLWLGCGRDDRFQPAARLISPRLPPDQVFVPEGGHEWSTWLPLAGRMFAAIEAQRRGTQPPR